MNPAQRAQEILLAIKHVVDSVEPGLIPVVVPELETKTQSEETTTKNNAAEDLHSSPETDHTPDAGPSLQNPTLQDSSSQTPGDTIDASAQVDADVELTRRELPTRASPTPEEVKEGEGELTEEEENTADETAVDVDPTPLPPRQDTPEDRAAKLWSLALEHLQKRLSIEETLAWLISIGVDERTLRRKAAMLIQDSSGRMDRTEKSIASGLIRNTVHDKVEYLQLVAPKLDQDDSEFEEDSEEHDEITKNEDEKWKEDQEEDQAEDGEGEEYGEGDDPQDENNVRGNEKEEENGEAGGDDEGKFRARKQKRMAMKTQEQILAAAMRAHPYASIVWALSYTTLKVRFHQRVSPCFISFISFMH